ncbi:hypothetical protein GQ44DRAFT_290204 [Phaeosphaeriaceae sp. PMI808]|nr:hypothetical protein GQ44DRAFT_290204 [Phaeosphaeriaceae sp. PMI808]
MQVKELPLHLIQLIISHLDNVADLARITRTSRLFYYMTLPRLYEHVTLHAYPEIRYTDQGRPEGYGSGSPFAMGLNTLVTRTFTNYVHTFRVVGDWRVEGEDDYKHGRVPDNSMLLQIVMRAVLDKMKNLRSFAWELNTKPLNTVYEGLASRSATLTSFTLRCPTRRLPQPTTIISPMPNLRSLVVYDMDPLCYPDDLTFLILAATKLERLKLHWSPRMREIGEESINLMNLFGRCVLAKQSLPIKKLAIYNLYTRFIGSDLDNIIEVQHLREVSIFNSIGSSDPMTVFLDDAWRINSTRPIPPNLKMIRTDHVDFGQVLDLTKFTGLERLYIVSNLNKEQSKISSAAISPTQTSATTPPTPATGPNAAATAERHCAMGSDCLAAIQSNHRTIRHLLLSPHWQISDTALHQLCTACPDLEQLGFYCGIPPLASLRKIFALTPRLFALRMLYVPGSALAETMSSTDTEMHVFAIATEFWRPEYRAVRYIGIGDTLIFQLGGVVFPPRDAPRIAPGMENSLNAKRAGPLRRVKLVDRESVKGIEIWGMDSLEFSPGFA